MMCFGFGPQTEILKNYSHFLQSYSFFFGTQSSNHIQLQVSLLLQIRLIRFQAIYKEAIRIRSANDLAKFMGGIGFSFVY